MLYLEPKTDYLRLSVPSCFASEYAAPGFDEGTSEMHSHAGSMIRSLSSSEAERFLRNKDHSIIALIRGAHQCEHQCVWVLVPASSTPPAEAAATTEAAAKPSL